MTKNTSGLVVVVDVGGTFTEQDFVAESLERQSLKIIAQELKSMGIPFKL